MSRWTDEELRELVTLWPTHSASQIAKRLHRLRSAIRGKAVRLRQEGLLPPNLPKHFDVNPRSKPRPRIRAKPLPPSTTTLLTASLEECYPRAREIIPNVARAAGGQCAARKTLSAGPARR